jgi:hypothetical protein
LLYFAYLPLYDYLLVFPFARLLAQLRLDPTLPSSTALGPSACFFFNALMIPALAQSIRADAPRCLSWILLVVPPITCLLLVLYLRGHRATYATAWWQELWALLLRNARLPVLFCLGELGVIAVFAYGTG